MNSPPIMACDQSLQITNGHSIISFLINDRLAATIINLINYVYDVN